ncbi:MAG: bifunctional phosphopantothenoylcysteine decarboxylase/phosphopantothenate--cysteine ligase CoaBC, partial [Bacteroidota bacterium]
MTKLLQHKKILLCVTGSIAAYKAAFLTRLLVKSGAEVQILMTPAATAFISSLTLSTLSRRPVYHDIISEESWNNHVELGLWADAMLIAPCTATTLAKLATGLSDNIVVATYLSARCPVFFAPAMDLDMWQHPATRRNLDSLAAYGNHLIPVGHGELASGLVGEGRMGEPEEIVQILADFFQQTQDLAGQRVLITAGPTHEPIDPVRFIGNRSSGKMGLALAEEAARRGAQVDLVLGPAGLRAQPPARQTPPEETAPP